MPKTQVHCLVCAQPMKKVVVAGGIEVDCCDAHGVWLDVGEMAALLNHAAQGQATPATGPRVRAQRSEPSALATAGKRMLGSAASGAGFGLGSALAGTLVRKLLG